jgi:cellulose synthase/poly-beta-1,6-N-acetylglucosamine synthase-like glycosyltransferase
MLERLLRCLAVQETGSEFEFSVVVVDNDAQGSARDTVSLMSSQLRLDSAYDVGRVNTIPAARNHALRLARGNYIGIIDDDEFPPQQWLLTLYRAIRTFDVDGALGPVIPFFDTRPPEWLIKGRFCERPVHRTGTVLDWHQTRTGNVLLKRQVFDENRLLFDESFTTGGSDREFFKQAMRCGCRFVAVEEAPVYEMVPPDRQTKTYWLRRALVNGFNSHRNSLGQVRGLARLVLPVRLAGAVLLCGMAAPVCAVMGTHALVRCLERGGHHLSRLCAMFGIELIKQRSF